MTHTFDDLEGATVILGRPGLSGSAPNPTVIADVAALKSATLGDHADTTFTSPASGEVVMRNSAGKWVNGTVVQGLASARRNNVSIVAPASSLDFSTAFAVADAGSGRATIDAAYGTAAGTIAQGNHVHNPAIQDTPTFGATGVLSSGTRILTTINITLLAGITYDITADLRVCARNNINNGNFLQKVQIAGGPVASLPWPTVGGVPIVYPAAQDAVVVGTGAAIALVGSVTFNGGDPIDFLAGQLVYSAKPRR